MSDQEELISRFIEVSGGDDITARFYLSSSNWSLEDALSNFLGNQNDLTTEPSSGPSGTADLTSGSGTKTTAGRANEDTFEKSSNAKPRFGTLNDMSKRTSNEEEGQAFYAGGSEHSGQQVLGPPKRKNFREQLTDIFRMAQDQRDVDDTPTPSTSTNASWGQGVRLGMTNSDHTAVLPTADASQAKGDKKPIVVLKLWSQGFSVDDGELRLYDDPENKEFLETVMRGEIPHELVEMGWMVNVDVEDHRHEDYKNSTKTKIFKGSGQALGSPVPNIENTAVPSTDAGTSSSVDDEATAKAKVNLNTAQPTTTLQIRLADGSRLTAQFNLSHTVSDIQQYIQNARPQYRDRNFILVSSFPTRELKDTSATIESAGLKNAALMQRFQ